MKIKDSLDLNGWVLSNFCIQSDSDLDTYKGKGRKLLYSGNATDEKHNREVIMGLDDKWRVAAYLDDITAIQEQLDLLTGEVDTSELISNLEDVLNFLNNIKENDGDLMTMLDGKLDKTGGTIRPNDTYGLTINAPSDTSGILLQSNGTSIGILISGGEWGTTIVNPNTFNGIGILNDGTPYFKDFITTGTNYTLLHSGNIGEYKAGGIISSGVPTNDTFADYVAKYAKGVSLVINSGSNIGNFTVTSVALNLGDRTSRFGRFIFERNDASDNLFWQSANSNSNDWGTKRKIAFTDSNVASAQALVHSNGAVGVGIHSDGRLYDKNNNVVIEVGATTDATLTQFQAFGSANDNVIAVLQGGGAISLKTKTRDRLFINSSGNVTIGASDLAGTSAKLYVNGDLIVRGAMVNKDASNNLTSYFGDASSGIGEGGNGALMYAYGERNLYFYTNGKERMLINSSGNVLIGTSTDDNSGAKLQVNGGKIIQDSPMESWHYSSNAFFKSSAAVAGDVVNILIGKGDSKHNSGYIGHYHSADGSNLNGITFGGYSADRLMTIQYNGNVLIGTSTELKSGSKLQVKGDLYVEGNIIATKEVSAGGPAEESGEGGNTGGSGAEPYVFTFTPSTTTVTVNHNISSEDVIVQVYEKDATSGKWSVILVDIEIVDSTRVDLHFGRTETTEHKVVIIG